MMQTVGKFPFQISDIVELEMPEGAEILVVESQPVYSLASAEQACMWARVDTEAPMERRRFRLCGTGHPLKENVGGHYGSFQMAKGRLVWHVFAMEGGGR